MGSQRVTPDLVTKQQQGQQLYKTRTQSITERNIHLSCDPAITLGRYLPRKMKTCFHKHTSIYSSPKLEPTMWGRVSEVTPTIPISWHSCPCVVPLKVGRNCDRFLANTVW